MKYLLAVDGSDCSKRAAQKLEGMVHPERDEVDIICIGAGIDMNHDYRAELIERLQKLGEPHKVKFGQLGVKVKVLADFGDPREKIVSVASKEFVDVIVLGTHGTTSQFAKVKDLVLGSVAQYCMFHSGCACLIVK